MYAVNIPISIDQYNAQSHPLYFNILVKTVCGKVFQILKTSQGFGGRVGYYISPQTPLLNGEDEVAVRQNQDDVVLYLEKEGWLDYKKMDQSKKFNSDDKKN